MNNRLLKNLCLTALSFMLCAVLFLLVSKVGFSGEHDISLSNRILLLITCLSPCVAVAVRLFVGDIYLLPEELSWQKQLIRRYFSYGGWICTALSVSSVVAASLAQQGYFLSFAFTFALLAIFCCFGSIRTGAVRV